MLLRLTHLLAPMPGEPDGAAAALAVEISPGASQPRRFIVPGHLPCGECSVCRQGGAAACPRTTSAIEPRSVGAEIDVADRFVYAVAHDASPDLSAETLLCAPAVALILDATARASLGPSDLAIWVGGSAWFQAAATHSALLGRTTLIASPTTAPGLAEAQARPVRIRAPADQARAEPEGGEDPAAHATSGHGQRARRIFAAANDQRGIETALGFAEAGATLTLLGPATSALPAPTNLRMGRILLVEGYHPDFMPEAVATLQVPAMEQLRQLLVPLTSSRIVSA